MGRLHLYASLCASVLLVPLCARAETPPDVPELPGSSEAASAALLAAPPAPTPANPQPVRDVINVQVGTRLALRLQNPAEGQRDEINDAGSDGEAEVVLWGNVHPFLKWQLGVIGRYGEPSTDGADLLDLVGKIELAGPLNLWIGRMPMPSDRTSLSTDWSIATWTLPGSYSFYAKISSSGPRFPPGPRYGKDGRGDGATLWGQVGGGTFKYYVGAFGLGEPSASPLYSARLSFSLLNPEPGFRTSSTYYGTKDVLAFGVGVQHRTGDSRQPTLSSFRSIGDLFAPSSFNALTGDLLFEKGSAAAGVLNVEGGFTKLWGDGELASYQAFGLISYLLPIDVGIGRFQPLVRLQRAGKGKAIDAGDFTGADAQLGYIIDGLHARLLGTYQYSKLQGQTENAILIGLQLLSHAR
jgi:hypothetical protein